MSLNKINKNMIDPDLVQQVEETSNKFGNLSNEVASTKTQLAETGQELFAAKNDVIHNTRAAGKKRCIVSFISDDGYDTDYTILKPILEPYNIPCGMALISSYNGQITKQHLKEALELGWDFSSHTVNHPHLADLTTKEEIEYQLKQSKIQIKEKWGIDCEYIVYPFGSADERVRKIASKYYKFGLRTGGDTAAYPLNTYSIRRVSLGAYFDTGSNTDTLAYYKSMFDKAYKNNEWIIFMLHASAPEFNATQRQHLIDTIKYIKTFADVPVMTVTDAYKEYGNMISVGDGTNENLVITNAGDIIERNASFSNEVTNQTKAFLTGTGSEQINPLDFVDSSPAKIKIQANESMSNPKIMSVGKNIWSGIRFAKDVIDKVNDPTVAYYTVIDGRRCLALKALAGAMTIPFFSDGFIEGKQYTLSGEWKASSSNTANGATMIFRYTDSTTSGKIYPANEWKSFAHGSARDKIVQDIRGSYSTNNNTTYYDIDTLQLEIGEVKTSFETYKETCLEVLTDVTQNDILTFENNKLYKNIEQVPFKRDLRVYKNGTIYVKGGYSPTIKIIYPLNRKAKQDLINEQTFS